MRLPSFTRAARLLAKTHTGNIRGLPMKITRIAIHRTHLPYAGGAYGWGAGNAIGVAQSTWW